MADNISNIGSFTDNIFNGNASIAPLPANRMETKYEVTVGGEHMTITNNVAGGLSVNFSHDTRELRPPGWQRDATLAFLGNPQVMNLLELQGIKPSDVLKQSEKQFGRVPDRSDPMKGPDSLTNLLANEDVGRQATPHDPGLADSLMKKHDTARLPGRSPVHRAPALKPPGF